MRKLIFGICLLAAFSSFEALAQKRLTIIHTNDTHSHLEPIASGADKGMGGVIERAAYIDSVRRADGRRNVLLLHAGDFSQGTSYFPVLHGDIEIDLINALKYDCVVLGNHEFDNGIEELGRRLSRIKCPVVCANYDLSPFEAGKYVRPYAILHKAGRKIGIFGLLTDLSGFVKRSIYEQLVCRDMAEVANHWADYLKNEERCDLVIALTHIGFEKETFTDPMLVRATRNIDLVVGGHSHTFLEQIQYETDLDGRTVPIVQDGCWGLFLGNLKIQ